MNVECLPWIGTINSDGYGQRSIKDKTRLAHRLAWEASFGPIPKGLCVCHKCDNRRCVNPKHLFLGTPAENSLDMHQKGRHSKGAKSRPGHSRNPSLILEVKALIVKGYRNCEIMRETGIGNSIISRIRTGAIWGDL